MRDERHLRPYRIETTRSTLLRWIPLALLFASQGTCQTLPVADAEALVTRAIQWDRLWDDPLGVVCSTEFSGGKLTGTVLTLGTEGIILVPSIQCKLRIRRAGGIWRLLVVSPLPSASIEGEKANLVASLPRGQGGQVLAQEVSLNVFPQSADNCAFEQSDNAALSQAVRSYLMDAVQPSTDASSASAWLPGVCRVDGRALVAIRYAPHSTDIIASFGIGPNGNWQYSMSTRSSLLFAEIVRRAKAVLEAP